MSTFNEMLKVYVVVFFNRADGHPCVSGVFHNRLDALKVMQFHESRGYKAFVQDSYLG